MSPPARKNAELFRLTAFAFADVGGHLNDLLAVRGTSRQTRAAEKAIDDSISDCFGVKRRNIPFPQQYGIVDCVDFESQYAIALLLLCDTIKGSEEQDPGPDQLLATFHRDMIMFASGIQFGRQPRINLVSTASCGEKPILTEQDRLLVTTLMICCAALTIPVWSPGLGNHVLAKSIPNIHSH